MIGGYIDAFRMMWDDAHDPHRITLVLLVHCVDRNGLWVFRATIDRFGIRPDFPNRQCESWLTDF